MHDLEYQLEDYGEDAVLLHSEGFISEPRKADPASKWSTWAKLGLSVIIVASACALYVISASNSGQHNAYGLRQPSQYPGLELSEELGNKDRKAGPMTYFPNKIVRVNKALPDQVYTSGSHVILSDDDSMFFQWHLRKSKFTSCYIDSVVAPPEDGLAANKTYTSSGSLTHIQIWNVTTPTESMKSLSWNSRPQRIALMGTVAFLPQKEKIEQLELEDGWESLLPTRFSCGEKMTVSIEVACEGCRLEFEQLFSFPPLAFDLTEIG
ncbi:hypothetical protein F4604DRAFT_1680529 [Suillus subluteus]|nr:hypothetical protein F4604DRAFT_1680529 [Suillus subluteus]